MMANKTCPNCANRKKPTSSHIDSNGGDFWLCTAKPSLPEFCGAYLYQNMGLEGSIGMPINLNLFKEPAPTAKGLNARSCELFTPRTQSEREKDGENSPDPRTEA